MNAIQPSPENRQPSELHRTVPRTQRRQRRHSHRAVAVETTARLAVNIVLCAAAIAGLVQLLPYQLSQQSKLREVRAEAKRTEKRLGNLRTDFSRSFDSSQAKSVMQEQSFRSDPNLRRVVFPEGNTKDDN